MKRYLLMCSGALVLSACAYMKDTSIQDVRIETPGAKNAICHVDVDRLHYRFQPPQTRRISKSRKDMKIDCYAPGNRYVSMVIEAEKETSAAGNIATGVLPGMAWDAASRALYKYPEVIYVDFTHVPLVEEALPAHNNPDIKQPEEYRLEEFRPSVPRLNEDMDKSSVSAPVPSTPAPSRSYRVYERETSDKGDLMNVIDHMFDPAPRTAGSGAAYPGE